MDGAADAAETIYTPFQGESDTAPVRLIVRRVKPTPGSQLALFASYSYHGFITDRDGDTLELEADHRRHAVVASHRLADGEGPVRVAVAATGLHVQPGGVSIPRKATTASGCSRPKSNRQVWVSGVTSALAAVKSTPKSTKLSPVRQENSGSRSPTFP